MNQPVKTFIIYAHEDISVRDRLRSHLHVQVENGSIDLWGDYEIKPGEDWDKKITERLTQSELLILLLSADFFGSNYIRNKELPDALRRHESGECRLLPVVARDCDWEDHPIGKIQAVPSEGRPIDSTDWPSKDTPYRQVVEGIKTAVREIREEKWQQEDRKKQLAAEEAVQKQREREQAAKAKAEGVAYDKATEDNTEQGWEFFLKKYPKSLFRAQAQKKLDALRKIHLDEQKRRDKEVETARKEFKRLAAQQRAEREASEKRADAESAWQQEQQRQRDEAARKEREEQTRRKKEEAARKRSEQEATRQRPEQSHLEKREAITTADNDSILGMVLGDLFTKPGCLIPTLFCLGVLIWLLLKS